MYVLLIFVFLSHSSRGQLGISKARCIQRVFTSLDLVYRVLWSDQFAHLQLHEVSICKKNTTVRACKKIDGWKTTFPFLGYTPEIKHSPCKIGGNGRLLSSWDGVVSGAMSNFQSVFFRAGDKSHPWKRNLIFQPFLKTSYVYSAVERASNFLAMVGKTSSLK